MTRNGSENVENCQGESVDQGIGLNAKHNTTTSADGVIYTKSSIVCNHIWLRNNEELWV